MGYVNLEELAIRMGTVWDGPEVHLLLSQPARVKIN